MADILIADMREPLCCQRIVACDYASIGDRLSIYGQYQVLNAILDKDGIPIGFDLPEGMVHLTPVMETVDAAARKSKLLGYKIVAGSMLGFMVWLMVAFAAGAMSDRWHNRLPEGLTSFEYYRLGASCIARDYSGQFSWSFDNLCYVGKALDKATSLDPNGVIGRLALNCKKSELPFKTPSQFVLFSYQQAISGKVAEREAVWRLQQCIKTAPDFEWPYASLAEI